VSDGGQLVGVPTIINKLTTNTVEIASIRIYATELQSLVEIAASFVAGNRPFRQRRIEWLGADKLRRFPDRRGVKHLERFNMGVPLSGKDFLGKSSDSAASRERPIPSLLPYQSGLSPSVMQTSPVSER
jgi:hypothetical protein